MSDGLKERRDPIAFHGAEHHVGNTLLLIGKAADKKETLPLKTKNAKYMYTNKQSNYLKKKSLPLND